MTPPPPSLSTETEETLGGQEAIVEEEEEEDVKEFVVGAEEELDEQDAWEEDTVDSVVETASQIQSKGKQVTSVQGAICWQFLFNMPNRVRLGS